MSGPPLPRRLASYYRACLEHPHVVEGVERILEDAGAARISVREVADGLSGAGGTYDQVAMVLSALRVAGAVEAVAGGEYVVRPECAATRLERDAALEALLWAATEPVESRDCELLVATPADAQRLIGGAYKRQFLDLRTALRSLIAEARSTVTLAAPFWDAEVAADLAEILKRRQPVGVRVTILARQSLFGSANERALSALRVALPDPSACQIRILDQPSPTDPFGSSTFHFKAASADASLVYVGSANFNTAGLGSRWELGVLLRGRRAAIISELLDTLVSASRPF